MTQVQRRDNALNRLSLLVPCLLVPLFWIEVGQLQAPKYGALPYCPTFFTFLLCIERKLKARVRAMGATTCPLCSCVRGAGKGWTVGQPSNGAACACPTAPDGSRTKQDSRTEARGVMPRIMQPSPSASLRCAGVPHGAAGNRYPDCIRSGCTSATGSFRGCSSARVRQATAAAASAC